MSIIEKAMDKLVGERKPTASRKTDLELLAERKEEDLPETLPAIEKAINKLAAERAAVLNHAEPATDAPVLDEPDRDVTETTAEQSPSETAAETDSAAIAEIDEVNSDASNVLGQQDDIRDESLTPPGDEVEASHATDTPKRSGPQVTIPFDILNEKGMITPQSPRSLIAEEFRGIKRPLLNNISGNTSLRHPNLIMVTSALQGDGKTFSAINLALSIAMEQDKTVLFVDADVAQASAGKMLGVPEGHPGLIDVLDGSVRSVSEVILKTNVHNLRVLPSGNVHDRSTELLASEAMHKLMLEMANRYPDRVILFDSPPLLLTSEAVVLANFMGQIVFVVAADSTPKGAVTEALGKIGKDKAIGMLLNRASQSQFGFGGYKYGYGYGYGYGHARQGD